jgi:hypothetical protein
MIYTNKRPHLQAEIHWADWRSLLSWETRQIADAGFIHTPFPHLAGRGGGPQGIFTVRPELLVPFAGEWAA